MKQSIISTPKRQKTKANPIKDFRYGSLSRLSVYKSNTATYAQLIDDENAVTLAAASSAGVKETRQLHHMQ